MKIVSEISLSNFHFWSGAKDNAAYLTEDEFDQVEAMLEDCYPDGLTDTDVNDLFWFDFDTIWTEWLGYYITEDGDYTREDPEEPEETEDEDEESED